ncbi:MAG: ABC transporter permease subunit [Pseudomonadota bacterium]
MSSTSDPAQGGFRLSQLIYDTRYRSNTIQTVALIALMAAAWWLVNNTLTNLEALGKGLGFGFLGEPASYDINQKLVEYNSRDPHSWAAVAGVLNTLLVALMGCITATIIGVFVGVLRLSNNWLISRLMTVYVEMFRNVPLLLWILIVFGVMIEIMPPPKEFRGEDAAASMYLFDSIAVTNQGIFLPRLVGTSLHWLFFVGFALSIGSIVWLRKRAERIQNETGDRPGTFLISTLMVIVPFCVIFLGISALSSNEQRDLILRDLPGVNSIEALAEANKRIDLCVDGGHIGSQSAIKYLEENEIKFRRKNFLTPAGAIDAFQSGTCSALVVTDAQAASILASMDGNLTVLNGVEGSADIMSADFTTGRALGFDYPGISEKGIPRFEGGTRMRNSLIALWLALSLYTAAFIAEIVRAGIMAISRGQTEASYALGISPGRTMSLVVLPQALRVIIPPLISQYLNLTKNSSLAIAVGYMDITGTLMGITLNQTGREMETILLGMLIYLTISLSISAVMNWYNNRVKLVER